MSPSPPFSRTESAVFRYRKSPHSLGSPTIYTESRAWIHCRLFPHKEGGEQNATRNGGPRIGACFHRVLQGAAQRWAQSYFIVTVLRDPFFRKVWVSIKFLSARFGFTPPQKGPKEGTTVQISIKSSKVTLFPGGNATRFYGQNDSMDIWAFLNFSYAARSAFSTFKLATLMKGTPWSTA